MNEFRVGYNRADTDVNGVAPTIAGLDLSSLTINMTGSIANTGIAGQGANTGFAVPGGLLRQNSANNGRAAPYRPYSLSLIDTVTLNRGSHTVKMGGEIRMIRMTTDRQGGTTYAFANLNAFLANTATISYLGDLSEPSVFNDGATGQRRAEAEYYIGYVQDEFRWKPTLTIWSASASSGIRPGRSRCSTPLRRGAARSRRR